MWVCQPARAEQTLGDALLTSAHVDPVAVLCRDQHPSGRAGEPAQHPDAHRGHPGPSQRHGQVRGCDPALRVGERLDIHVQDEDVTVLPLGVGRSLIHRPAKHRERCRNAMAVHLPTA